MSKKVVVTNRFQHKEDLLQAMQKNMHIIAPALLKDSFASFCLLQAGMPPERIARYCNLVNSYNEPGVLFEVKHNLNFTLYPVFPPDKGSMDISRTPAMNMDDVMKAQHTYFNGAEHMLFVFESAVCQSADEFEQLINESIERKEAELSGVKDIYLQII